LSDEKIVKSSRFTLLTEMPGLAPGILFLKFAQWPE